MQTLDSNHYLELEILARKRGVTLQQFLRAVVVPEWMGENASGGGAESRRRIRTRRLRSTHAPVTAVLKRG